MAEYVIILKSGLMSKIVTGVPDANGDIISEEALLVAMKRAKKEHKIRTYHKVESEPSKVEVDAAPVVTGTPTLGEIKKPS